jgi:hypothetical protein
MATLDPHPGPLPGRERGRMHGLPLPDRERVGVRVNAGQPLPLPTPVQSTPERPRCCEAPRCSRTAARASLAPSTTHHAQHRAPTRCAARHRTRRSGEPRCTPGRPRTAPGPAVDGTWRLAAAANAGVATAPSRRRCLRAQMACERRLLWFDAVHGGVQRLEPSPQPSPWEGEGGSHRITRPRREAISFAPSSGVLVRASTALVVVRSTSLTWP